MLICSYLCMHTFVVSSAAAGCHTALSECLTAGWSATAVPQLALRGAVVSCCFLREKSVQVVSTAALLCQVAWACARPGPLQRDIDFHGQLGCVAANDKRGFLLPSHIVRDTCVCYILQIAGRLLQWRPALWLLLLPAAGHAGHMQCCTRALQGASTARQPTAFAVGL